jgi:hypothetical protein
MLVMERDTPCCLHPAGGKENILTTILLVLEMYVKLLANTVMPKKT